MGKDVLIVIDMQNDFISGTLANPAAEAIVPKLASFIKTFPGWVYATKDTHLENSYPMTKEGQNLPILHCIYGTHGWQLNDKIDKAMIIHENGSHVQKSTFAFGSWYALIDKDEVDNIYITGTCTDICVISNAMMLKAQFPETNIIVLKDLCAGTSPEAHEIALKAMAQCQIIIM